MRADPQEGDDMPRTTKPPKKPKAGVNATAPQPPTNAPVAGEVLTLAEAAAYLRLPEEEVVRLVYADGLPGRATGQEWRFLKTALQDWLRTPPARGSKEALMSVIGSEKDDPFREDYRKEISRIRGRPMFEGCE
jgi:excisionase family DNA binding protein